MSLKRFEKNIKTQSGEDGVIEEIFNRIGIKHSICVEFGAWDGIHLSNSWRLWHDNNWSALLIEGEADRTIVLKENTKTFSKVKVLNRFITISGESSLDNVLKTADLHIPFDFDFLSIDIDTDDYHIFDSLKEYKPRVIAIEYNGSIPPFIELVQEPGEYIGSSALSILKLAHLKGYKLAHITNNNLLLVVENEFEKLGFAEPVLAEVFPDFHLCYVITAMDGRPLLSKIPPLLNWIPLMENDVMEMNLTRLLIKKIYRTITDKKWKQTSLYKQKPKVNSNTKLFPIKMFQW